MEDDKDSSDSLTLHRKNSSIISWELPNIPQEIIEDILVKLPVKSLARFKCVSKPWLFLISSQKFIKSHLRKSIFDPNFSNHRLMFHKYCHLKHCSVSPVFRERESTDAVVLSYPKQYPRGNDSIVGSCNGLICIVSFEKGGVFLWNPSLRMFKKLPHVMDVTSKRLYRSSYSFGYDASNDDYKVVEISKDFGGGDAREVTVSIYSLKNDSWKKIENSKGVDPERYGNGKFANGKLHYFPLYLTNIVTLDVENEVFETVEPPHYGYGRFELSPGVLNGCFTVLCSRFPLVHADVWVLKEYGVKDGWTKVASIPYVKGHGTYHYTNPLCMQSDGKILLANHWGRLFVYDPEDNSLRHHRIKDFRSSGDGYMYVESLVPLPK